MKLITTLLLSLFIAIASFAQDHKYEMSEPIDVSLAGWNKVLLLRNGNTIFFHFENRKGIIVKIFDKDHKEIAAQKLITKILDINTLDRADFEALIDIDGNATLFVKQEIDNRGTLVRIIIDGMSGKISKEEKLVQSASFQKRTVTQVLHLPEKNDYYVVSSEGSAGYAKKKIEIQCFDATHRLKKNFPVNFDQEGYDNVIFKNAQIDKNGGILVGVENSKIIQYPNLLKRILVLGYLSPGSDDLKYTKVELPNSFDSYDIWLTHNRFAKSLNVMLSVRLLGYVENGLMKEHVTILHQGLILINEDFSANMSLSLENKKVKEHLYTKLDTNIDFHGRVLTAYTNKYGLSTVIFDGLLENKKNLGRSNAKGTRRVVGVTQYDDKGAEIWGNVIARSRIKMFDLPYPQALGKSSINELDSANAITTKNNFYVVYNEVQQNYNISVSTVTDSVYNHFESNAVCYKIGRKKEMTKTYLLGEAATGEYKQLYTGSGDFNEETGAYACVFLHRKGKDYYTKIAWVHFEP